MSTPGSRRDAVLLARDAAVRDLRAVGCGLVIGTMRVDLRPEPDRVAVILTKTYAIRQGDQWIAEWTTTGPFNVPAPKWTADEALAQRFGYDDARCVRLCFSDSRAVDIVEVRP